MAERITVTLRDHGQAAISANYYSRTLIEQAHAVPGVRWEGASKSWVGYVDAIAAIRARLVHKGITVSGTEVDLTRLDNPESWRTARTPYLFATKGLRDYQVEGVRFLITRSSEGALLADGMRLGKTCQAITAARAFKQKTLIVAPSHAVGVWGRPPDCPEGPGEIAKWWPDAWAPAHLRGAPGDDTPGVVTLEGVKPDPEIEKERLMHAVCIVCSYDIVYAWVDILQAWGFATFIVDECHLTQGYESRRSGAVRALREHAARVMFLSGTPMIGRPRDLHNVIDTLCPGRLGYFFIPPRTDPKENKASFARLYCNAHQKTVGKGPEAKEVWDFNGASNLDEPDDKLTLTTEETLKARLKHLMLRRIKSEVDKELPKKTRQIIDVAIPAAKMVTVTPALFSNQGKGLRKALDLAADGKLKHVLSLVKSHVEEGEKIILFCFRRAFAEVCATSLRTKVGAGSGALIELVHGGVLPHSKRDKAFARLRAHHGPAVLCCTIDTTSTAIDLSFASVGVFGEFTWQIDELAQAEERLYAFGGAASLIQYVVARGTSDELIVRALIQKLDNFERSIGSTGDGMKASFAALADQSDEERRRQAFERLEKAMEEMHKAQPPKRRRA
jgi:superfamily II DNA or RNA helicase